ncbi:hypothetical protein TNCV_3690061 [Trichonephila clavipes]|uniref:Uncharacterized protein n=1 Tax=Trichonephila clavipes TaxID=2585209 RepID=A0A8X6SSN1_TRICX|nr:hypothetical protein TNCV_3690061 [Trichonephila clavipes]
MQILLTLLKSLRKGDATLCLSQKATRRSSQFKTPKTLHEDIGSCAIPGPNSPNGSNSLAIVEKDTSLGVGIF